MNKCKNCLSVIVISLLCFTGILAQEFHVVGFLPHYRFQHVDDIQFDKVTHVNLAFANPDMEGNLSFEGANIEPVVEQIHAEGKEVFISLAGGYLTPEWDAAWIHLQKEENRSAYIHKIMQYCNTYSVEGIDMDLEWQYVGIYYSEFVIELGDSCQANSFQLTASLPGTYRYPDITDEALEVFDWINMMVYDLRGPWNPSDAGPHSPYYFALNSLYYWNEQGIENDRLTMGLPFYGYDFTNTSDVFARTYRNIVDLNPINANYDQFGEIYYNGIPSIKAKTTLAMDESLRGVMIWELGQDHFGEYSLLDAIDEVINPVSFANKLSIADFSISPNPANDYISINSTSAELVTIYDFTGKVVIETNASYNNIDISHLTSGMYVISLGPSYSRKIFVKQ